jgi:hypothetical protein
MHCGVMIKQNYYLHFLHHLHLSISQKAYYVNIYQKDPVATGSAIQFALAYGDQRGSGSLNNGGGTVRRCS